MSDHDKTFRKSSCWYSKMIQTKNKQINKQTNKQINNFLDPKYLSQMKYDLHEIFRVCFWGCPKMNKKTNKSTNKQTNQNFLRSLIPPANQV